MNKRKWRVMLTLTDDTDSDKDQIEYFVKEQLEEFDNLKVSRCEAVEVSK